MAQSSQTCPRSDVVGSITAAARHQRSPPCGKSCSAALPQARACVHSSRQKWACSSTARRAPWELVRYVTVESPCRTQSSAPPGRSIPGRALAAAR